MQKKMSDLVKISLDMRQQSVQTMGKANEMGENEKRR